MTTVTSGPCACPTHYVLKLVRLRMARVRRAQTAPAPVLSIAASTPSTYGTANEAARATERPSRFILSHAAVGWLRDKKTKCRSVCLCGTQRFKAPACCNIRYITACTIWYVFSL